MRIALITGRRLPTYILPENDRLDGYLDALDAHGLHAPADLREIGEFTTQGGDRAMTALLNRSPRPTAVFCLSDEMAYGALQALRRAGLRPGSDRRRGEIAVIGFDGHDLGGAFDLSTVCQPVRALGRAAADLLMAQVNGVAGPQSVTLPTTWWFGDLRIRVSRGRRRSRHARNRAVTNRWESSTLRCGLCHTPWLCNRLHWHEVREGADNMRLSRLLGCCGLAVVLALAACSSSKKGGATNSSAALTGACAKYSAYAGHKGSTVTMFGSILSPESDSLNKSWAEFDSCTGITIKYTGSNTFESDLPVKVNGGNAPDLANIPQPGLLQQMVATGSVKAPPAQTVQNEKTGTPRGRATARSTARSTPRR